MAVNTLSICPSCQPWHGPAPHRENRKCRRCSNTKHECLSTRVVDDSAVQPVQATDDPSKIGKVDVVLVGIKAWQVPEAAEAMRPMIGPETRRMAELSLQEIIAAAAARDILFSLRQS